MGSENLLKEAVHNALYYSMANRNVSYSHAVRLELETSHLNGKRTLLARKLAKITESLNTLCPSMTAGDYAKKVLCLYEEVLNRLGECQLEWSLVSLYLKAKEKD